MMQIKPPVEFYKPLSLSAKRLDSFLAAGWFRSSNGLFRNKLICLNGQLCTVVNSRLRLNRVYDNRRIRKIRNKNAGFRVETGPLDICEQMQALYLDTKNRFKGFVFPDIFGFLYDFKNCGIFNSYHVKVYDGEKLVACSVFDLGQQALMSVIGLYDPDYKPYSPGFFTMLCETDFGRANGYRFYYPGYVIHETPEFNYKLGLGEFEFLNHNQRWTPNYESVVKNSPVKNIMDATMELEKVLSKNAVSFEKKLYKFFSIGYAYPHAGFFKEPIVFLLKDAAAGYGRVLSFAFNFMEGCYTLRYLVPEPEPFLSGNHSEEFLDDNIYYEHILFETQEFQNFYGSESLEDFLDNWDK